MVWLYVIGGLVILLGVLAFVLSSREAHTAHIELFMKRSPEDIW